MARILIVGCGCRGRALAEALIADGYAVRGTTRTERELAAIEAAGAEGMVADPLRLATMMRPIDGATVACWLLGSAAATADDVAALHGPRLDAMIELLVDTHVRGLVYEASGSVDPAVLEAGRAIARTRARRHSMPIEIVDADAGDRPRWIAAMRAAVAGVIGGRRGVAP